MKNTKIFTLIICIVLSVVLVSGCSSDKKEKPFSDWNADDIEEIQIAKMQYRENITDKDEIKEFVDYLQGATIISSEQTGTSDGWTYGFDVKFKDGEYKSYNFDSSVIWWQSKEYKYIYTVDTDYFRPLTDKLDALYDENM